MKNDCEMSGKRKRFIEWRRYQYRLHIRQRSGISLHCFVGEPTPQKCLNTLMQRMPFRERERERGWGAGGGEKVWCGTLILTGSMANDALVSTITY